MNDPTRLRMDITTQALAKETGFIAQIKSDFIRACLFLRWMFSTFNGQ